MFIPHTDSERDEMLKTIGVKSLEDLFANVPAKFRFPQLNLPPALCEMEAFAQAQELSMANVSTQELICFLGAGAYHHYIPALVDNLLQRGEFYSSYTPYQPEVSQGTLQAIFEYQSLISALTGMDVSNASHYDGATATAEAGIMAISNFRGTRNKIIVSKSVHPHYRQTLRTYLQGNPSVLIVGDEQDKDPLSSPDALEPLMDYQTALVIVQYPDFFGQIFALDHIIRKAHEYGALVAVVTYPISLGLIKPPGSFGADIVVGEGQSLGIPLSFGGPYLGFFATKKEYVRKISGRLVGETTDAQGRKGYVLTLTPREQHIRREKATSNICTNQGLMALAATIYLSALGKHGLKQVANLCYQKAQYAADSINQLDGFSVVSKRPFFNEFVVQCPYPVDEINNHLLEHGILGGVDLKTFYPELEQHMLIAVTEMNTREEIDALCHVLQEVKHD